MKVLIRLASDLEHIYSVHNLLLVAIFKFNMTAN